MTELSKERIGFLTTIVENLGHSGTSRTKLAAVISELAGIKPASVFAVLYGQAHFSSDTIARMQTKLAAHQWANSLNFDVLRNPNAESSAQTPAGAPATVGGAQAASRNGAAFSETTPRRRGRPPGGRNNNPAPPSRLPTPTTPQVFGTLPSKTLAEAPSTSRKLTLTLPASADLSTLEIDISSGYLVVRVKL